MKKFIFLNIIVLIFCESCSDNFIDLSPVSQMSENEFYHSESDFKIAVNAIYANLYTLYGPQSGVSWFGEQMSDNCTLLAVAGDPSESYAFDKFNLHPYNSIILRIWNNYYQAIYTANNVIDKLSGSNINENTKTELMAEAKFLRALFYFNLVRMFGDIPLVEKPVSVPESYKILRSPTKVIYDSIIQDLQFAAQNLPLQSKITQQGKASKGAAQTLLGKVYLTIGQKGKAKDELYKVIQSKEYLLLDHYAWLWDLDHKNSKESIFEIQYKGGAGNPSSTYWSDFAPYENFSLTTRGGGMNVPTQDLYNEYEPDDPRRKISIADGYYDRQGNFVKVYYTTKWVDSTADIVGQTEQAANNFILLRYADVLLMYAEATDDPTYLNMIRKRAGLPYWGSANYPSGKYYSDDLSLAIEHERRVEFAFEFKRFFYLKRTERALPVMKSKGFDLDKHDLVLPIPQSVIDQNPLIKQNPDFK